LCISSQILLSRFEVRSPRKIFFWHFK